MHSKQKFLRSLTFAALTVYDYVLTLPMEVEYIWPRKLNLLSVLFAGLRYSTLATVVSECFTDLLPLTTTKGCITLLYVWYWALTIGTFCVAVIFTLRLYAIWGRNKYILSILSLLLVGGTIALIYEGTLVAQGAVSAPDPYHSVSTCLAGGTGTPVSLGMANKTLTLAFDILVMVLTAARTVKQVIHFRHVGNAQGLSYYILRDGIWYFSAITVLQLGAMITQRIPALLPSWTSSWIASFQRILSFIIAERLVLNLRQVDRELNTPTTVSGDLGELDFAHGSLIGNVGAPLRTRADESAEDVVEKTRVRCREEDQGWCIALGDIRRET